MTWEDLQQRHPAWEFAEDVPESWQGGPDAHYGARLRKAVYAPDRPDAVDYVVVAYLGGVPHAVSPDEYFSSLDWCLCTVEEQWPNVPRMPQVAISLIEYVS